MKTKMDTNVILCFQIKLLIQAENMFVRRMLLHSVLLLLPDLVEIGFGVSLFRMESSENK